jgi:ketosteroid isomerase-like protein
VSFTPGDALAISEDWIYGIAHVAGTGTGLGINSGKTRSFRFTVTWLLHRQPDGSWKIKRKMWNHKPSEGQ